MSNNRSDSAANEERVAEDTIAAPSQKKIAALAYHLRTAGGVRTAGLRKIKFSRNPNRLVGRNSGGKPQALTLRGRLWCSALHRLASKVWHISLNTW
jgi:hypothetical protein